MMRIREGYYILYQILPDLATIFHELKFEIIVFVIIFVYSGILEKFDVTESKQIDYITLTATTSRDLREGSQVTETPSGITPPVKNIKNSTILIENGPIIPIPGKFFTIPGTKILNVNVTYLSLG